MDDRRKLAARKVRKKLYQSAVRVVVKKARLCCFPAYMNDHVGNTDQNRKNRIEIWYQRMMGDHASQGLTCLDAAMRSPEEWIYEAIQTAADGDAVATEALDRVKARYRVSGKPMPEPLRTWHPPKPTVRRNKNVWRNKLLAEIVREIEDAVKRLPPELRLSISRNVATEEYLSIYDAVAEGWNRAWRQMPDYIESLLGSVEICKPRTARVTYDIVRKAHERHRGKRK